MPEFFKSPNPVPLTIADAILARRLIAPLRRCSWNAETQRVRTGPTSGGSCQRTHPRSANHDVTRGKRMRIICIIGECICTLSPGVRGLRGIFSTVWGGDPRRQSARSARLGDLQLGRYLAGDVGESGSRGREPTSCGVRLPNQPVTDDSELPGTERSIF